MCAWFSKLVGDFNTHNYLCGGNKTDAKGKVMETFMTGRNIYLFDDDNPTHLHPSTGTFTSIQLTMCSPSLFMERRKEGIGFYVAFNSLGHITTR